MKLFNWIRPKKKHTLKEEPVLENSQLGQAFDKITGAVGKRTWILDNSMVSQSILDYAESIPLYIVGIKNEKVLTMPMKNYLEKKSIAAAIVVDVVADEIEKYK